MTKPFRLLALFLAVCMIANYFAIPGYAVDAGESCCGDYVQGEVIAEEPATCTEYGYITYACANCGAPHSNITEEPIGHDYIDVEAKAPTCDEQGWDAYQFCANCGDTTYAGLISREHDLQEYEAKTPNCSEIGFEAYVECKYEDCDYTTYAELPINPDNHVLVFHEGQAPDCLVGGYADYYTCELCDYTTYEYIECPGHQPGESIIEPGVDSTCSEPGTEYQNTYCTVCGELIDSIELPVEPKGHVPAEVPVVENFTSQTCTEDGSYDEVYYCTVCGGECGRETKALPANTHYYGLGPVEVLPADCVNPEREIYVCQVEECGYELVKEVGEPLGHTWTDADCFNPVTCSVCGETEGQPNPHVEGAAVPENVVEATCLEAGSYDSVVYCVNCDTELSREVGIVIDALGHDVGVVQEYVAPTCTEEGSDPIIGCRRCLSDLRGGNPIPALGHDEVVNVAQDPTCTDSGWNEYITCTRCDYSTLTENLIEALGHECMAPVEEPGQDPTCTEEGYYFLSCYCDRCGDLFDQTQHPIAPIDHAWDEGVVTTDPTCEGVGTKTYTCSNFGCTYTEDIEPLGHDIIESLGYVDPTCYEDGYTIAKCSREGCGTVIIEDLGSAHHNVIEHEAKAETCEEIGWNAYQTCDRCDWTTYEEIPALGHDLTQYEGKNPTCTEIGWNAYEVCNREGCDYNTYEEIAALGHDIVNHDAVAPTCIAIGWDAYETCSRCDYTTYVELAADANNHVALEQIEAKPHTCLENGWLAYEKCDSCGYTTYAVDAAPGHSNEAIPAVDATCTETGLTAGVKCSVCEEILTAQVETPALGHDEVAHEAQQATCTQIGWFDYVTCNRCDYTTYEEIPMEPHAMIDATFDEAAHCANCDYVEGTPIAEEVVFTYEAVGINDSENAVNSGYVTVKVYMNVETEIARLYAVDLHIGFNEALTLVSVEGNIFENMEYNTDGSVVIITQDLGFNTENKVFAAGEYLFATLTFKVDKDFCDQDAFFSILDDSIVVRNTQNNELYAFFGDGTMIHVDMLGDGNEDGVINSADTLALAVWYADADLGAYNSVFDMNKDGYIDAIDIALLRGAVVRDNSYLDL